MFVHPLSYEENKNYTSLQSGKYHYIEKNEEKQL